MRLPSPFRRRSEPESDSAWLSGPATRYDAARLGESRRVAILARALDQATLRASLALALAAVLAFGNVALALRGGVRPVFVPYDAFGRVIPSEELARFRTPPRAFVEAALAAWLADVRTIHRASPAAQLDRARAARALLSDEAEGWLQAHFAAPERNPLRLLRDRSRTVELVSLRKDPDRNLYYLQWREIEISDRAGAMESAWQGTIRVDFVPPPTEAAVWLNPAGIQIRSIEWNRLHLRPLPSLPGGSSATAPAAP